MVSTMSADLVSLPLLHEPVSTTPCALMVCYWCVNIAGLHFVRVPSLFTRSRSKVLHKRNYRSISRLCGSDIKGTIK